MEAREYFKKEYGHEHIETVVEMKDWVSLYGLMDEFAEWKVKNCSIPAVVGRSEQLPCEMCGGKIVKEDKFTDEKYCENCGWF